LAGDDRSDGVRHAGHRLAARIRARNRRAGVTGFIVENEAEAIDAIERIPTLKGHRVRATFERRFTARRMAESYRRCFQRLGAGRDRKVTDHGARSNGKASSLLVYVHSCAS
jgi:hypothetical protein